MAQSRLSGIFCHVQCLEHQHPRCYRSAMRHLMLRCLAYSLVLLTFIGVSWLPAAPASPPPCAMAMSEDDMADMGMMRAADPSPAQPYSDTTPACAKRICCLVGAPLL